VKIGETRVKKLRFLIIGVGAMGRLHIRRLRSVPEAEVVGLVNLSSAPIMLARRLFPELAATPVWSDYQTALREIEADAAIVATPHSWHFEHGMACLDAGLHVLMEKPLVSDSVKAAQLAHQAELNRKHLAVVYPYRLEGPFIYLRNLLQAGELGNILFISAYQAQSWLRTTADTWRQNPDLSCGGQLNDSGSHLLDMVLWMTGLEPIEIHAVIDNRTARVDVDTALNVRFRGGAIASFNVIGSASINWWVDVSIHGDKGTALYRNQKVLVARSGDRMPGEVAPTSFPSTSDPDRNFVDLLLGRITEAAAPARSGVMIARLTEAAYESARSGQCVRL
jgi:predicted dehydrogenase